MRYEMNFGDAILMTDYWNTVFTATMHFIVLKLWMTHKQMMNWILSRTFLTKEPIYNLSLKIYASLPMSSVCVSLALLHFRTPPIVIDDSSWKNAAESFTVALTLTLGGGTKVQ